MKYNTTTKILAVCAALGVVSCTSLPGDINKGIAAGSPHAYYEAGKHIDNTPVANDAPPLLNLLFLPFDIPLAIFQGPRMSSCFYYRSYDSRNRESIKYFKQGADLGDADCQYEMGLCYEKGYGVNSDLGTAKAYYMQAAAQGNANAKERLVGMNATSPSSLTGKTFCFSAPYTLGYSSNRGTFRDDFYATDTIVWKWGNNKEIAKDDGEMYSNRTYAYKKTGRRTAVLETSIGEGMHGALHHDSMGKRYELNFETPTSGTCTLEVTGRYGTIGADKYTATGRFTIK